MQTLARDQTQPGVSFYSVINNDNVVLVVPVIFSQMSSCKDVENPNNKIKKQYYFLMCIFANKINNAAWTTDKSSNDWYHIQLFRERMSEKSTKVYATLPKSSLGCN